MLINIRERLMPNNITKNDVIYNLKRMQNYIERMDDLEWKSFAMGMSVHTNFQLSQWRLNNTQDIPECPRRTYKLEIKMS